MLCVYSFLDLPGLVRLIWVEAQLDLTFHSKVTKTGLPLSGRPEMVAEGLVPVDWLYRSLAS
jgi:hypothetical protein